MGSRRRATFRIALGGIKVDGKAQPQLANSLGTRRFPAATFALTRPVTLGAAFAVGTTVTTTAVSELTMNGIAQQVQVTLSGRRDGRVLQAAGSIPVPFPDWSIKLPTGFGFFGSLADHGTAEFRLILRRQSARPPRAG